MTDEANSYSSPDATPHEAAEASRRRGGPTRSATLLILALTGLAAGLGWHWYDTTRQFDALRTETAQRLRETRDEAHDARVQARDLQEQVRQLHARTGGIEVRLLESQSQQESLESLYSELSRNRDDWLLAEAEQTLSIASQQLQLAGNVQAALSALQTVDARLAAPDRPQFLALRKVFARDIERLRAAPNLDVQGMTLRLDQSLDKVDALPLAIEAHARESAATNDAIAPDAPWWRRATYSAWVEIRQLVRVERLDVSDRTLLSPEQRYFLRENLKLRLLHARLALLQRDEQTFRNDLNAAHALLKRHFDMRDEQAAAVGTTLSELAGAAVNVELPSIAESLAAVRNYAAPKEGRR